MFSFFNRKKVDNLEMLIEEEQSQKEPMPRKSRVLPVLSLDELLEKQGKEMVMEQQESQENQQGQRNGAWGIKRWKDKKEWVDSSKEGHVGGTAGATTVIVGAGVIQNPQETVVGGYPNVYQSDANVPNDIPPIVYERECDIPPYEVYELEPMEMYEPYHNEPPCEMYELEPMEMYEQRPNELSYDKYEQVPVNMYEVNNNNQTAYQQGSMETDVNQDRNENEVRTEKDYDSMLTLFMQEVEQENMRGSIDFDNE